MVLEQEVLLRLEELVHVLDGVAEQQLVARLLERGEQAHQLLLLVLATHVQVLLVLQEDGLGRVGPKKKQSEMSSARYRA